MIFFQVPYKKLGDGFSTASFQSVSWKQAQEMQNSSPV